MRLIYCFMFLAAQVQSASDPIRSSLDRAIAAYDESYATAKSSLLKRLEAETAKLQARGDLAGLKTALSQKASFETSGALPTFVSTRSFERTVQSKRKKLLSAYESAIRSYTQAGQIAAAEQIQAELRLFQSPLIRIFNGADLSGWENSRDDPSEWSVIDNQLVASGGRGYLYTRDDYSNFELHLEARVSPGADSGVFVRCQVSDAPMGYEVDLNSPTRIGRGSEKKTGTIRVYPRSETGFAPVIVLKSAHRDNQWFELKIVVQDRLIIVSVDGKVVARYTDDQLRFTKGRIALQHYIEDSEVRFRNITVKRLPN